MSMATQFGIIRINDMTPQQERIFSLQAKRAWGPFTQDQYDHMNTTLKRAEPIAAPTDLHDRIRFLRPGETLDNIQTIPMPGEERTSATAPESW